MRIDPVNSVFLLRSLLWSHGTSAVIDIQIPELAGVRETGETDLVEAETGFIEAREGAVRQPEGVFLGALEALLDVWCFGSQVLELLVVVDVLDDFLHARSGVSCSRNRLSVRVMQRYYE